MVLCWGMQSGFTVHLRVLNWAAEYRSSPKRDCAAAMPLGLLGGPRGHEVVGPWQGGLCGVWGWGLALMSFCMLHALYLLGVWGGVLFSGEEGEHMAFCV